MSHFNSNFNNNNHVNNNNNNVYKDHSSSPRSSVKFSALDMEEDRQEKEQRCFWCCTRTRCIKFGLVFAVVGLIAGGVSFGVGLYFTYGIDEHISTTTTTTIKPSIYTTKPPPSTTTELPPLSRETTQTPTAENVTQGETTEDNVTVPTTLQPTTETLSNTTTTLPVPSTNTTLQATTPVPSTNTTLQPTTNTSVDFLSTTPAYQQPECKEGEFQCRSGQCIQKSLQCDGNPNCHDKTDEYNCPNCSGFTCDDGLCIPRIFARCNGVFDCGDSSDEKNCGERAGYHTCKNNVSIADNYLCNGFDDCGDNSDEENCKCSFGKVGCLDGKCIWRSWVCDGYSDCVNGTDELNCGALCNDNQYKCSDHTCKDLTTKCDGVSDCPDGGDEKDCVSLGQDSTIEDLEMIFKGENYHFCSVDWSKTLSERFCQREGYDEVAKEEFVPKSDKEINWFIVSEKDEKIIFNRSHPLLHLFNISASCESQKFVRLACHRKECGERKMAYLSPLVAGGQVAPEGKWPWVVALSYLDGQNCGGTLISSEWVVTATHCVYSTGKYDYTKHAQEVKVHIGSRNRKKGTVIRATKIYRHPDVSFTNGGTILNDVALIRLERPVTFSNTVQPICMSGRSSVILKSSCYLAGWGRISWRQYLAVDDLRDVKMEIWDERRCARDTVGEEKVVDTNSTICGGYRYPGTPTGCKGDSGGPLMCLDGFGRWQLVGIMSSGSQNCGEIGHRIKANRYMKIDYYKSWIDSIVGST